jgi:predicted GH43/DUF377 family glycosyl hydrolase
MRASALAILAAATASCVSAVTYTVTVSNKAPVPVMSIKKAVGQGYSPCECTFNPAWMDAQGGLNQSILIMRVSGCPDSYGGSNDHLLYATCSSDGTCDDLSPMAFSNFPSGTEDPRAFFFSSSYPGGDDLWYLYTFCPGPGQNTVCLSKASNPLDISTWKPVVANLPWHRNGCVILREDGNHYVIYGESGGPSKGPLPGIGIASTRDFVNYTVINATWLEPLGPNNTAEPEIVLEAASNVVQLSTGDYLHIYAAGTPGWVANGNYTGGFIILAKDDPTQIIQRSDHHVFVPTMDYEIGDGIWPVQRNRTMFVTSLVPIAGQVDTYRVWYGAADANIATAILTVTHD